MSLIPPATLHDVLNDRMVTWDGKNADDFRKTAIMTGDALVAWKGQVFDGWGSVSGGLLDSLKSTVSRVRKA